MRSTGTFITSTTLGEPVQAFVPHSLPPAKPPLAPELAAELRERLTRIPEDDLEQQMEALQLEALTDPVKRRTRQDP